MNEEITMQYLPSTFWDVAFDDFFFLCAHTMVAGEWINSFYREERSGERWEIMAKWESKIDTLMTCFYSFQPSINKAFYRNLIRPMNTASDFVATAIRWHCAIVKFRYHRRKWHGFQSVSFFFVSTFFPRCYSNGVNSGKNCPMLSRPCASSKTT